MGLTYKKSGVDVEGGGSFVKKISPMVRSTFTERVIADIGGFGALYSGSFPGYKEPVLVSGTDGVGTKLKIAQRMNRHDTIGIDAVAMCVNDIIVSGAKPLFFLDYISCGRLQEPMMVDIIKGMVEGCRLSACSLIGGETAEHPDVMAHDDYDIAGFAVGVVDRPEIIDGSKIKPGDMVIGLPSSGVHSNGYSLVRKLFFDIKKFDLNKKAGDLHDTLGNILLTPTRIYVLSILKCLESSLRIKGIVHITGGGFYENIPRILPEKCAVKINKKTFMIPEIFKLMQKEGDIEEREMFTTFNMGIGLMIMADQNVTGALMDTLINMGEKPVIIGEVINYKDEKVIIL